MSRKVVGIGSGILLLFAVISLVVATSTPGTLEAAKISGEKSDAIITEGRELGLTCLLNTENCAEMIDRAKKNPQLKSAFLKAKEMGVSIYPHSWFLFSFSVGVVEKGYVTIDIRYSDEAIIEFLIK